MNRTALWSLLLMVLCFGTAALAQNASAPKNPPIAMRATHLLGFEGAWDNINGTLSIQGDAMQFHKDGKPEVEIKIDSIQDVFVGAQSREIGGTPTTFRTERGLSSETIQKYDDCLRQVIKVLGDIPVPEFSQQHLLKLKSAMLDITLDCWRRMIICTPSQA